MSEGKTSLPLNLANVFQPLTFQYIRRFDIRLPTVKHVSLKRRKHRRKHKHKHKGFMSSEKERDASTSTKKMNDPCAYAIVEAVFMGK